MPDPTLNVEMRDPRKLTPYIKNNKVHSRAEIDQLAGLIAAFGFDQPIVVDDKGVIIKGHKRREAAIQLGLKSVPCVVSEGDEYANMANRLADNFSVGAAFDEDKIAFDLGTLKRKGVDLKLTAIGDERMPTLLKRLDDNLKPIATELRPPPHSLHDVTDQPRLEDGTWASAAIAGAEHSGGDGTGPGLGSSVVQCNLIFDDTAQQERWHRFSEWLKENFRGETLAARLDGFLAETLQED